ncbi:unnamed protein product [Ceutorhynchus assimilis]|uniref:UV radiation resistance associated protein n=1 Tax=Ceutorhynchus assimilis TaxID=467358 RepID=A0A9P0DFK9_9CUCU|nr:unnamed protein product [Ceutorhynchus assimilis]
MDCPLEIADTINFTASEFALGRQRCRKWASLITQQLRLRHVYQIYAYNVGEDKKAVFYFTLHSTPMSSPFYTSEKVGGKNPKWNELLFSNSIATNVSSVVIRVWKHCKKGDEILLTWGVNFSGLVYLGNKIADLQPKYFKANTVIFFMQGVYFTSQHYLSNNQPLPFQKNLNLIQTSHNEQVLYRQIAFKAPKSEITSSYTLEKLRRLQELQRQIKNKQLQVETIKEKIKKASERELKRDTHDPHASTYSNNIRFAPQLLTMNSLNKMLHEKPTKAEKEAMTKISKQMEVCRFRLRILNQERDVKSVNLRRLKQRETKLKEDNIEKKNKLMSLHHELSKESVHWDEFRHSLPRQRESLMMVQEQLHCRQLELLKELLFIYPIDKMPNENKYTMLGIHLPDSELLLDYQDPGVSVVLGYICHILIMCSIFLQVPLRHPMKHFGSRSVIYNQVYPEIPDKEREFPLYTKGKDRAHFSYAVFLLNKNISQFRWFLHHKLTVDLKETLKHLRNLLLAEDLGENRRIFEFSQKGKFITSNPDIISPSMSSISSSNLIDPLIESMKSSEESGTALRVLH